MINYGVITKPQDVWELSLGEVIARTAALVPDKIAIKHNTRTCTYYELNAMADALAAGLASIGIQKGERVAILSPTSIEALTAYLAVAKIGAVSLGLNPRYRDSELRFSLENSETSAIITTNRSGDYDFISTFKNFKTELNNLRYIITLEPTEESQPDSILFSDLLERHKDEKSPQPELNVQEDTVTLLYTSGTTGVPKGAITTHYQAMRNSSAFIDRLNVTADDVILLQLPWFHAFATVLCLNLGFITGATLVIQDPYNPVETLKMIEENKVTVHHGTPAMFLMEMNHKDFNKYDLSSLRAGVASGAAFSPALVTRITEEMGLNIISSWGMTELSGGGTSCKLSDSKELKAGTVGLPSADCKVKVCDANGTELPIGEVGELWFWGWLVTKGYWNNEEETKKQITQDGWMKTGDLARILENGYVQLVGRQKEMINRGGYKVYPNELEDMLLKHPKIAEVAIVGIPNEILGELICVCVIPKDKSNVPDILELRELCKDKIADYKLPDELCIMDEFSRTVSGKARKLGEEGIREIAMRSQDRQNYREIIKA